MPPRLEFCKGFLPKHGLNLPGLVCPQVSIHSVGDWWTMGKERGQVAQCAERAITSVWGTPPLYVREGGTMPVAGALEQMLQAPAVLIPFGQSSDNAHLANERIRVLNLLKGKDVVRKFLEEMGAMACTPGAAGLRGAAP